MVQGANKSSVYSSTWFSS